MGEAMKDHLLVVHHLGLGDHILCNAIYRHLAIQHELVCLPVKYHNVLSVQYMLRDVPNIVIRPVEHDEDMVFFRDYVWRGPKFGLGMYGGAFKPEQFDREFYRQAGLDFDLRWEGWKCERDVVAEQRGNSVWFADETTLVHDDYLRGMEIDWNRLSVLHGDATPINRPSFQRVQKLDTIFDYWGVIERVPAIHCINSSFALFVDSLKELPMNPKLYLHLYARPGGEVPTFKKNWIKLI